VSSAEEPIEPTGTPEPQAPPAAAAEPAPESIPVREPQAQPAADARPAPESIPAPSSAPRTVGRAVADRLAAAGSRYAFTVPGESFLGLLDGLVAAGIEVVLARGRDAYAPRLRAAAEAYTWPRVVAPLRAFVTGRDRDVSVAPSPLARPGAAPARRVAQRVTRAARALRG